MRSELSSQSASGPHHITHQGTNHSHCHFPIKNYKTQPASKRRRFDNDSTLFTVQAYTDKKAIHTTSKNDRLNESNSKNIISGDTLSPAVTVCRIPVEGWLLTVRSRSLKRKSGASVKCRFGNLTTLLLLLRLLLLCRVFISRARVTRFFNLQTLCLSWPSLFCPQGGGFILILPTSSTFPVKPSFFLFLFLSIPGSLCLRIFWCGLVDSGWFIGLGCVLLLYLMTSWSGSSSFRLYSWYLLLFWSVSIT